MSWGELIPVASLGPINVGLSPAQEHTMISLLGRPIDVPDSKQCYNAKASATVKKLLVTRDIEHISVRGVRPAVDSLQAILTKVKATDSSLFEALDSAGMLCVRMRRPTSGVPSKKLSNHSWGTALDVSVEGTADVVPDGKVQKGIAAIVPFFNAAGWYSGIGFRDDTHFEVAEETIQAWAKAGLLEPPIA